MSKTEEVKKELTDALKEKYDYLSADDVERAYNYALADYLLYKYPSENNRPTETELEMTFVIQQWISMRMEDILARGGGSNYDTYSENGVSWKYAQSHIDPHLVAKIVPEATTPQ